MKSIITMMVAVTCALALTGCGGGGGSSNPLTRADEGIWSDLNSTVPPVSGTQMGEQAGMQAVILDDGSFWGLYGALQSDGTFYVNGAFQSTASVSGNSVSVTYTDGTGTTTYSGPVSAQNNISLSVTANGVAGGGYSLSYDSIYNQPASLSAIAGNYVNDSNGINSGLPGNNFSFPGGLIISGSRLTLEDTNGNVIMTGTVTPHGTTVNVFDVSLTVVTTNTIVGFIVPDGTTARGILFQTSFGSLKNDIEIVAGSSGSFYYIGKKQG